MLQNTMVAASTVSELLRENQQGGKGEVKLPHPSPTRLSATAKCRFKCQTFFLRKIGV